MALRLDKATLEAALVGYQQHLHQIEAKMAELRGMLGGTAAAAPAAKRADKKATPAKKQRHAMSAEGRARIAAAQRARWAKAKKAQ